LTSLREQALEERRQAILPELKQARELEERARAENRGLTADEQAAIDGILAKGKQLSDDLDKQRHDAGVWAFAKELSADLGLPGMDGGAGGGGALKGQRMSFGQMGAAAATKIAAATPGGLKALAPGGATVVAQTFQGDVVELGKPATSLLDVVPVVVQPTPQFAYLRQSSRVNAAGIVAEGAVKGMSTYTVTRIEDQLDVVAHLSEAVPRYWIADNAALEAFLSLELEYGLQQATEAMIVADVAATSGIQTQAYSTSVLQTVRKSLTKLETSGYVPAAIALNPLDFEGIELALSTVNAVEYQGLPFDAAARRLWGTPLAVSNAVTAGTSYTLAAGAVGLNVDNFGVQIAWSETSNADDWSKNMIRARCEGRYATSVFAPLGVVVGDLTP
jgi:HK97 family phage major capsid protein